MRKPEDNWNDMDKGPYMSSTPKQDPTPRIRYEWIVRGEKHSDWRAAAGALAGVWISSLVICSIAFVNIGLDAYMMRWFGVEAGFALLWALIFVTRKPIG